MPPVTSAVPPGSTQWHVLLGPLLWLLRMQVYFALLMVGVKQHRPSVTAAHCMGRLPRRSPHGLHAFCQTTENLEHQTWTRQIRQMWTQC